MVVAFTVSMVTASILQCTPIGFAFDRRTRGGGICINFQAFWLSNAIFNILSDLVVIALPISVIRTLQLPIKIKIAICGVFAVGILYVLPFLH